MSVVALIGLLLAGAWVHRPMLHRFGSGTLFHLVRLPGNLLHELAHALVTLACGYTIAGFTVSLFDPEGRGGVQPGRPFLPWARPWLANLLSPIAPVGFGLAALVLFERLGGAPGLPVSPQDIPSAIGAVPWPDARFWAVLALAVPVSAEMAPSDVDLRIWRVPAIVLACVCLAGAYAAEHLAPGTPLAAWRRVDAWLLPVVARGVTVAVWATLAWAPVAWLAGRVNRA
jgi:hypothetical protein